VVMATNTSIVACVMRGAAENVYAGQSRARYAWVA
jgi:hypothetical protein